MTTLDPEGHSQPARRDRPTPARPDRGAPAPDSTWLPPADDVATLLERAMGIPPGSGRVAGSEPDRHQPAAVPDPCAADRLRVAPLPQRGNSRRGLVAGVALVAVLAAAYAFVSGSDRGPAARASGEREARAEVTPGSEGLPSAESGGPDASPVTLPVADRAAALLGQVPVAWRSSCRVAPGLDGMAVASLSCTPGIAGLAVVELRAFGGVGEMRARYRAVAARGVPAPTRGAARCASGRPEERGWATPGDPDRMAGRYACRMEDGAAGLWWTADGAGVLVHAVRADGDLAELFRWWRSDSSPRPD